jgi:predicted AAA+ superfamily ATPase
MREVRHAMNLALFLFANTGQPFSLHSLTKSLAIPSVAQTSRIVEYLQDAYVMFALPRFSTSFKKRVVAPAKYYAIDNGLRRAVSPQPNPDVGRRLENAVFLALRRRRGALAYALEKDAWECDFVTEGEAIQVCARLTEENRGREVRGLVEACRLPGRRKALLLTMDQREDLEVDGVRIPVRPAWEWLMER